MEFEYKCPSLWKAMDDATREAVFAYGERYKAFLDAGKTERECAQTIIRMLSRAAKRRQAAPRLFTTTKTRQQCFL